MPVEELPAWSADFMAPREAFVDLLDDAIDYEDSEAHRIAETVRIADLRDPRRGWRRALVARTGSVLGGLTAAKWPLRLREKRSRSPFSCETTAPELLADRL